MERTPLYLLDETYESLEVQKLIEEARGLPLFDTSKWTRGIRKLYDSTVKLPGKYTYIPKRSMAIDPFSAAGSPTGLAGQQFEKSYFTALNMLGLDFLSQTAPAMWDMRPLGKGWPDLIKGKDVNVKRYATRWMFGDRFIKNGLPWDASDFRKRGVAMFTGKTERQWLKVIKDENHEINKREKKAKKDIEGFNKKIKSVENKITELNKNIKDIEQEYKESTKGRVPKEKYTSEQKEMEKKLKKWKSERTSEESNLKVIKNKLEVKKSFGFGTPLPKGERPRIPAKPNLIAAQEKRIKLYLRDNVKLYKYLFMAPASRAIEKSIVSLSRKAFKLVTKDRKKTVEQTKLITRKQSTKDLYKIYFGGIEKVEKRIDAKSKQVTAKTDRINKIKKMPKKLKDKNLKIKKKLEVDRRKLKKEIKADGEKLKKLVGDFDTSNDKNITKNAKAFIKKRKLKLYALDAYRAAKIVVKQAKNEVEAARDAYIKGEPKTKARMNKAAGTLVDVEKELGIVKAELKKISVSLRKSELKTYKEIDTSVVPEPKEIGDMSYGDRLKMRLILEKLNDLMIGKKNFTVYKFPKEFDVRITIFNENDMLSLDNYIKKIEIVVRGVPMAIGHIDKGQKDDKRLLFNGYKGKGGPKQGWEYETSKKEIPTKSIEEILWLDNDIMNEPPKLVTLATSNDPVDTPTGSLMRAINHLNRISDLDVLKKLNKKRNTNLVTELPVSQKLFAISSGTSKLKKGFFRTTGPGWGESGILPGEAHIKIIEDRVIASSKNLAKELPWVGAPEASFAKEAVRSGVEIKKRKDKVTLHPAAPAEISFDISDMKKIIEGHVNMTMKSFGLGLRFRTKLSAADREAKEAGEDWAKDLKSKIIRPKLYFALAKPGGLKKFTTAIRNYESHPDITSKKAAILLNNALRDKPFTLIKIPSRYTIKVHIKNEKLIDYVEVNYSGLEDQGKKFLEVRYENGSIEFKVVAGAKVEKKSPAPKRALVPINTSYNWDELPAIQEYLYKTVLSLSG